jgi:hypothetical protein
VFFPILSKLPPHGTRQSTLQQVQTIQRTGKPQEKIFCQVQIIAGQSWLAT